MRESLFDTIFRLTKQYARIEEDDTEFDDLNKVILRGALTQAHNYTGFVFEKTEYRFKARPDRGLVTLPVEPESPVRVYSPKGVLFETITATGTDVVVGKDCIDCCQASWDSFLEFRFTAGSACFEDIPADILMGIFRYFVYTYENRGDANQLNLTNINDALSRSGALTEWKPYLKRVT